VSTAQGVNSVNCTVSTMTKCQHCQLHWVSTVSIVSTKHGVNRFNCRGCQ